MEENASNPAVEATKPTPSPLPSIPVHLQIHTCPQCGILFAMPLDAFLQRLAGHVAVYCCNGHAIALAPSDFDGPDSRQVSIRLLNEFKQSVHENQRLRDILAQYPPLVPVPVDEKELVRRLLWIENRAKLLEYGRRECRFCGRARQGRGLRQHLKSEHRQEIIDLPAEFFT